MKHNKKDDSVFIEIFESTRGGDSQAVVERQDNADKPYAGVLFSVKDLFDLKGQVTRAGSLVLENSPHAERDATAIARLKAAGFVPYGRTNMTEFAYSGVGLNPHYGTPLCIWDRKTRRIPGGSSSGAALSVANGTVPLAIGTDTGGSCRIPAAFNGIVGFKSSAGRVPTDGVYPLAPSFDTVGPLAKTVKFCAIADSIMAADWDGCILPRAVDSLRLGILQSLVLDDLDAEVSAAFERSVEQLASAGVELIDISYPDLSLLPTINANGGLAAAEAYSIHRELIDRHGDLYDPRVRRRILSGSMISETERREIEKLRSRMISDVRSLMRDVDGLIMPTVAILPPPISDLLDDRNYNYINIKCLRNTFIANFLDCCAISLPIRSKDHLPVGLMIMAELNADASLFSIGSAIEKVI